MRLPWEAFSFGFLFGTDTTATLDEVSATFDGSTYYIAEVTGLSSGTTYYFKFFAENSNGRGYGQFWEFETQGAGNTATNQIGSFTDQRDGTTYATVTIGDQEWMAENLRYSYNMTVATEREHSETDPYLYYPNGQSANVATYGYLYNWPAAMNGESSSSTNPSGVQGICPAGWHLPSKAEWTQLVDYLGGEGIAGAKLAGNAELWGTSTITESADFGTSGFNAIPAGIQEEFPLDFGAYTQFWTTKSDSVAIIHHSSGYFFGDTWAYIGNSVRCLRTADNTASYQTGSFTDTRDGRTYDYVVIGDQTWMAENLRYDNSGSMAVALSGETSTTDPYLYYPNGESGNLETYGYLYNWPAAMNRESSSESNPSGVQGICPDGWHLPSNAEWTHLTDYLGGTENAGAILAGNVGAVDWYGMISESADFGTSGFNAIAAGGYIGSFLEFGSYAFFWTATENSSSEAYSRNINNVSTSLYTNSEDKNYAYSVRCVKDGGNTANNNTNENSGDIIYQCDFENGSEDNWPQLNNGDQTNYWTIGFGTSDATTTDTHCLYITNDGSSYNYNSGVESTVYAYKEIELPSTTNYHILFDWKCIGEEGWDYLRAFIIPTSENPNLSAGNSLGDGYENANNTPDGWIDLSYGQMASSDNQWQQADRTMALNGGNYYLVFYWRNDGRGGDNPPAAVDNIFIYKLMPISVTANVSDRTSTSATLNGTITFAGAPENIAAGFKWGDSQTSLSNNLTTQSTGETFSAQLTDLTPQTAYYYRAYAVYEGDTAYSEIAEFRTALDEDALGGANNPLPISDINDWQDFTEALVSYTIGTQYKGVVLYNGGQDIYFKLTSDLTFSSTFSLNSSPFFQGHLDGDGKSISFDPNQTFGGLFSSIDHGSVDNLNIIITDSPSLDGTHLLGMLSAKSMEASISNCTVSGVSSDVVFTSNDYEEPVGGLVGYATQTTISGCTNNLKISSDVARVGGIAGKADGTIMYCTNNAELSGAYVGGIMAEGAATITNCLNTGRINCSDEYAGGISGSGGNISTCMNIGEISATGTKKAGGIVGNAESATVTNCANYGVFTALSSPMGGIAGTGYGSGTYSHNVSAPIFRGDEAPSVDLQTEIYATVGGSTGDETDDFFDEQLGDIKVDSLRLRFIERGTRKTSNEMVGSALSGSLSSEFWDFTEGVYPKPKNITETPQTLAARIPIYLSTHEYYGRQQSVFGVWNDFMLPTTIDGQTVTWESSNTERISISNGTATVNRPADTDVSVMLTASYQGYSKWFTVTVIGPKQIPVNTDDAWQDSVISLNASFISDDLEGITYVYDYGFQYSTTSSDLSEDVTTVQSNNLHYEASAGFSYPLANIPEGTTVYFRAYATTADGTEYGEIKSHKALGAPVVVAKYPMWRTDNSATILFDITLNEEEDFNELENAFYYGTERNNLSLSSYIYYDEDNDNYSVDLHDLTAETRYYYVAEVTNRYGTSHSDTISFYTYGQMTDVDGNQYYTIQIGEQKWMAENLRATRFANGTEISLGTSISSTEPYRYYPNGDEANAAGYGYLYNWTAVMNGESSSNANPSGVQGICPNGWHVPSNAEWTQLTDYVGSQYACGGDRNQITKALSANTGWITYTTPCSPGDNQNLNNASGFNALTAGHFSGSYGAFGEGPYFWTATENDESRAYSLTWNHSTREVQVSGGNDKYGSFSIRCVKGSMTYVYDTVNFCGEEYAYHDTTYTESGDYVRQINISEDVDSTFYLHLTMFDELVATISDYNNGCYGQDNGFATVSAEGGSEPYNYAWNNGATTQTANGLGSGTYNITITDVNGCIAISSVEITQPDAITSSFAETACDSYEWNGTTYTETDDYTQTFLAANGCDSIVTLHLTINNATTGIDTQVACDSYTWIDGVTYTESTDVPTFTLSNAEGCDSVVTLHLTINQSNTGIDEQTACDSYEWIDGVTYTESTDASTFTLTNAEGCDSIVTLHLTINNSNTGEFADQMCSGVPYVYEGETFTEAGTYTVTLVNSHGCDSIVTLTLTYSNTCGGIVSGIVTDENTGDAIPNAKVTIGNRVTRTNAEGQYSLEVIRGLKALRVSATGYISYSRTVDIQSDTTFNASLNSPQIHTDTDSIIVSSYPYLEQSDSITLSNNGNGTLVWSSITEYDNLELIEDSTIQRRNTRSLWDSIQTFATRENAEQAIATDGFFIYTASWMRPGEFNRYTPNGEYVETFYVENVGSIRNLSYDGTYFYGTEATNIIFKIDLDNQMLVDSIETDIPEIRHCSFNRQDGSLLAGSWNSLYRIDTASGTSQQIRDDLANVYSSAFDNLSAGGPYLWLFSQTSQNNGPSACIRQFNISTGEYTSKTHYLDDINLTNSSLAGGICASEYVCEGRFVLLADVQNPAGSNTIATYEIGCTSNVVKTGKKSGMIEPNGSESISVKANATATGDYTATIKYRAAVMGRQSNDINVSISAVAPECDAVQQISIVTDTFHTVTLDWQPVELGNYESVSYLVFNTASQFAIDTVSETTVTYDGLPVGEHCFCVMALSQAGYTCLSAASDTVCVEIEPVPCNIALAVEATNDGESIFLTWNKPVGVEYFRIHRDDNAIEEVLYDDSFVDTNVVPEVTYCYTIFAYFEDDICNEIVGTACTKIVSGVCGESPVLQIEAVGYSVHLNWTATSDSYTYKIFRNDVAIGMTTGTTYFDNVNPGYNYCYKVESLCEYGMFTYSNEECVFVEVISEDENGQGSGEGDAIDEWTADNLTLYPNPTYGQFFIDGQRIAVVQIFNATGQLVTEIENTEVEHITINCDGWNPGIYNVRIISTEGESATRKVTIFR